MKHTQTPPWYKQFWPWFLITIPLVSMILSFTMLKLATGTKDSLVIDDYYKEGKGINLQLQKRQEAVVRNIRTRLQVSDNAISLSFLSGQPETGEALLLAFHHATLKERDFSILLTRDASGMYRGTAEDSLSGKWSVSLQPMDERWRFSQTIALPRDAAIDFNP